MSKKEATVSPYAGLKANCRHITSQDAVSDKIRFVTGTSVVGKSNQIQILEYDDIHGNIHCVQSLDHPNEIWWLSCHPTDPNLIFSVSSNSNSPNKITSLYKCPENDAVNTFNSQDKQPMECLATFANPDQSAKRVFFLPSNTEKCLISASMSLNIYDIASPEKIINTISVDDNHKIHSAAPDPLHPNTIAFCSGKSLNLWDMRTNSITYSINDAHSPSALDVAFNENKSFWICSGGSDGYLKCWDIRNSQPECQFRASSHWVTRTVPSTSHEQLILTSGTDSKVRVFNALKFAFQSEGKLPEGEIVKSIRHDDSVYCATWASHNPWVFASVSYKGQVNICQLPSQVVDSILMGSDTESD